MRLKTLFLWLVLVLSVISLVNCSRESSIKENVNLRNNHSVVFVYSTPFENPDAFADSIINLSNPDSVIVSDTVTVTIGDTIHMMGFLRYNADKIYLYQWILDSLVKDTTGKGKDVMKKALVTGHNATPQSWVYLKEGVYSPLFVAIDGNSATDTAGKDQFIRVINTPPYLGVPKDTLWTRAKSPITFPVLALDSFGTITSFKIDVDAKGKKEAKEWKYTKSETSDSLLVTIPYDSTLTDSLGNQKIYIIVTDDDKNTTKDSVNLHFNQLPTIKILGPEDQQRISDSVETFYLFYEGHDKDNEEQLRYYVRVAATPDNQESDLNLSNVYDLVLKNSTSTSFAVIEDGVNELKKLGFTGRYFSWDVWVTDGYDTVVAEKIKTSKGKRPRFFYLGPSKSTCDFIGKATFEGLSNHEGIKITLVNVADTNNIYTANTSFKGEFRVSDLPAGVYKLTASDETGRGFVNVTTRTPNINAGDEKELPPILLKDPSPPRIYNIKGFEDTLSVRAFTVSGRFSDYGSQVKTAVALLGNDTCSAKNNQCKFSNLTSYAWSVDLSSLSDGNYTFKITATDSAGYHSDTTFKFTVSATNMVITVNNTSSAMVASNGTLTFNATIEQANPPVKTVQWISNVPGAAVKTSTVTDGKASITLKKDDDFPNAVAGTRYTMYAKSDNGSGSNTVRFGFYNDGPMVTIEKPAYDTTITIGDVITVTTDYAANNNNPADDGFQTFEWKCFKNGAAVGTCLSGTDKSQTISWSEAGTMRIAVHVVNKDGKEATDTLQVNVIKDPPTITVEDNDGVLTKKVNSKYKFEYTAKDKYGTIKEVGWRCGTGAYTAVKTNLKVKQDVDSMEIQLPTSEVSNYKCYVLAIDDDNQRDSVAMIFNVIKDIPMVRLNIHRDSVTIKDLEQVKYTTWNTLGGPIDVDLACDRTLNNLKPSSWVSLWQGRGNAQAPVIPMPETAGLYYCVMRAADAEQPSLYTLDTATYSVFYARPSVTVNEYINATIKDTVSLYANAMDSAATKLPGRIVSYEWGCGPSSDNNILGHMTAGKATYQAILPSEPYNLYLCVVQVKDDDDLTARDTTKIVVELDPPTVKVARDSAIIREGFSIVLNATAQDKKGYIVKREWSCGRDAAAIASNWRTVSSFDTTWTAPAASANFSCVARVTDDDGNIATSTMKLKYSTDIPTISVDESVKYVAKGDVILLDADTNSVWQGIDWYSWQCFNASTKQKVEDEVQLKYTGRFYSYRETLSNLGVNLYCVVSAQESSTKAVFRDTTHVYVMTSANLPVGKITAVDTIYPWSGDEAQSGEALYYYSSEWSGAQSVNGTLGNNNLREYYWQFSNVSGTFYKGKADGTLDTNVAQFNDAFRRPTSEGTIRVCLDFRDSTSANPDVTFMNRHQAETFCRTVYVQRAWKNLAGAGDTVMEESSLRTPPALAPFDSHLVVAYQPSEATVVSKYYDRTNWTDIPSITASDSVKALRMTSINDQTNTAVFLAILTKDNKIRVYKLANLNSSWSAVGPAIDGATTVNLTYNPENNNPVVTYVRNDLPYFSFWTGSKWEEKPISDTPARDVNGVFTSTKVFLITFTDNTYQYNSYYAIYNSSYTETFSPAKIAKEMSSISIASNGGTVYLGYINRSSEVGVAGPYVRKGSVTKSSLSLGTAVNLQEGMLPTNIRVTSFNNKVYAIIDDNGRGFSHCHAYFYDGIRWKPYGENQLPYFKGPFYASHGYNLYGFAPEIVVAADGMVYISMISWTSSGAASTNNGPIFMKNISEKWTFNTKP